MAFYDNPGAMLFAQDDPTTQAFEATLAPKRKALPLGYTGNDLAFGKAPAGRYFDIGTGDSVGENDLMAHAAAGNLKAMDQINRDRGINARRQAYTDFMNRPTVGGALTLGGDGIQQAGPSLSEMYAKSDSDTMKSLMQAIGIQQQNFDADTKRGDSAIREFEQKVTQPAQQQSQMDREILRAQTEMDKAALSGKLMAKDMETKELLAAQAAGASPDQLAAIRKTHAANRVEYQNEIDRLRGGIGGKSQTGLAMTPDQRESMAIGGTGGPLGENADQERLRLAGEDAVVKQILRQALGEPGKESFSAERIGQALAGQAINPRQLKAFADQLKASGYGPNDQRIADLFRAYSRMSRHAGEAGGAGSYAIKDEDVMGSFGPFSGRVGQQTVFTGPQGALTIPKTYGASGTNYLIPGAGWTAGSREASRNQAKAISGLLELLLSGGGQ